MDSDQESVFFDEVDAEAAADNDNGQASEAQVENEEQADGIHTVFDAIAPNPDDMEERASRVVHDVQAHAQVTLADDPTLTNMVFEEDFGVKLLLFCLLLLMR